MLLEFRLSNFKSFRHENSLSMVASPQRDHNDSLIRRAKDPKRVLPVYAIFGANACGKTNLISALKLFRDLVMEGSFIKAGSNAWIQNKAILRFLYDGNADPVTMGVTFINGDKSYEYDIEIDIDSSGSFFLSLETLVVEGREVFIRKGDIIEFGAQYREEINAKEIIDINFKDIKIEEFSYKNNEVVKHHKWDKEDENIQQKKYKDLINIFMTYKSSSTLDKTELYLTRGFKYFIDRKTAETVEAWFSESLQLYFDMENTSVEYNSETDSEQAIKLLNTFLRMADFGKQQVSVVKTQLGDEEKYVLYSQYTSRNTSISLPSEFIESKGTLRLFGYLLPFVDALKQGKTLVIDELDASLHPFVLAKIVEIFMDTEINQNGAQLIFTTHSAILLDSSLMRRDSLAFVEKDTDSFESVLYTLADFKTSGVKRVRNDESYLRNYLDGKYGALPNINLSETVRQALSEYVKK